MYVDAESSIEEKPLTTEGSVGGESGLCEVETNQEPYEGMLFKSEECARAFYVEYAKRMGFITRIVSSRKSERDGSIISRRLACNKEGFNHNRQKTGPIRIRKRESKREGCMAMVLVKREKPGRWVITKFVRDHNHPLEVSSGSRRFNSGGTRIKEPEVTRAFQLAKVSFHQSVNPTMLVHLLSLNI